LLVGALAACGDDVDSNIRISKVSLSKSALELVVGHSETLRATVEPEEATYKELRWESNNPAVARVDNTGRVSAFAVGTAVVSVISLQDGSKMATCTVTVVDRPKENGPNNHPDDPNNNPDDDPANKPVEIVPVIRSFEPAEAGFDKLLTIHGENFGADASANKVTLNGVTANIRTATPDKIVVEVPKDKLSTGPVRVIANGKTVVSDRPFKYVLTATNLSTFVGEVHSSLFREPYGITIDAAGNLYVADSYNHRIQRITPQGVVSTFAGSGTQGHLNGTGTAAQFNYPNGITIDTEGNLYVADTFNHRIRKITPQAVVSTVAGSGTFGHLDNTGTAAQFQSPLGIAIDATGNLYVTDSEGHRIRKITPQGVVSTFAGSGSQGSANGTGTAAQFNWPRGIAIDKDGNLYVTDAENRRIRKITPQGVVTTFAGSTRGYVDATGTTAQFYFPAGIAIDADGNLYVTDVNYQLAACVTNLVRKITPQGAVSTIAGGGSSEFCFPADITIDKEGNLFVTDLEHNRIRKILME